MRDRPNLQDRTHVESLHSEQLNCRREIDRSLDVAQRWIENYLLGGIVDGVVSIFSLGETPTDADSNRLTD